MCLPLDVRECLVDALNAELMIPPAVAVEEEHLLPEAFDFSRVPVRH